MIVFPWYVRFAIDCSLYAVPIYTIYSISIIIQSSPHLSVTHSSTKEDKREDSVLKTLRISQAKTQRTLLKRQNRYTKVQEWKYDIDKQYHIFYHNKVDYLDDIINYYNISQTMQSALKELQEKFKERNINQPDKKEERKEEKKEEIAGNQEGFNNAKKLLESKMNRTTNNQQQTNNQSIKQQSNNIPKDNLNNSNTLIENDNKINITLPNLPPLPQSLPQPPYISSLSQKTLLPPPPSLNIPTTDPFPHNNSKQTNIQNPKQNITISNQSIINFTTKNDLKTKQIFSIKPKITRSLSEQLFQSNISGYFKSYLMSNCNILKTIQISAKRKIDKFKFPSIQQQNRGDIPQLTLIFHSDADIVPSYMQHYQSQSNKQIFNKHKKARNIFINKYQIKSNSNSIDWNSQDNKIKQLKSLKDNLNFIRGKQFIEIDYNIIKKTHHKINNIIKKFQRQQQYIQCGEYKKINQNLFQLYDKFWKSGYQEKVKIKEQLQNLVQEISRV